MSEQGQSGQNSREATLDRIREIVSRITLVDKETITGDSHLFDDLGVGSMDFIDIIYHLEVEFGIEVPNDSVFTDRDFFASNSGNADGGKLTAAGHEALKAFPYLNASRLQGEAASHYLYSVDMLVDYVASRQ